MDPAQRIIDFINSSLTLTEFCKKHGISISGMPATAKRYGFLEEFNKTQKERNKIARQKAVEKKKSKPRSKFNPISDDTKSKAINDYLTGKYTVREIGNKYGFGHRNLSKWFKECDRYDEFVKISRKNIIEHNSKPMLTSSKLKIAGINNTFYKTSKFDKTKYGWYKIVKKNNRKDEEYFEHRKIVSEIVNRKLLDAEVVHHIDLNPSNNEKSNLKLLENSSVHGKLHYYLQHALVSILTKEQMIKLTDELLKIIREEGLGNEV